MKITSKELYDYYRAKGVKDNCPFCTSTDWSIPSSDVAENPDGSSEKQEIDPLFTHFHLLNKDKEKTDQWFRAITMMCSNCGYVRLQRWMPIANWVKENRAKRATPDVSDEE